MELSPTILLEIFEAGAQENLAHLEDCLIDLESRPGDPELLRAIFRATHSLKGDGRVTGLSALPELAHGMEDVLDHLRCRDSALSSEMITLLLQAADAMRELVADAQVGKDELRPAHLALRARLEALSQEMGRTGSAPGGGLEQAVSAPRPAGPPGDRGSLRIGIDKLDRMLDLTGELAIARGRIQQMLENVADHGIEAIRQVHADAARPHDELQQLVMSARMMPLGPVFRRYYRIVRDLAAQHQRQARLVIQAGDVEVDTVIAEHLRDPLTHVITNAVSHGLESPAARRAQGKDPVGTVTLAAVREPGVVVVEISDDGQGLDTGKVLRRAREAGLVSDSAGTGDLDDEQIHQLVLLPGLSTAEEITDVSGRGVGLDVVRRNITSLQGSLAIHSRPGQGTRVTMRLPLTLAIIDGLLVGVGDEVYVIPLDSVIECLELPACCHEDGHDRGVLSLRGVPLPYVRLRGSLRVGGVRPARENIVVVGYGGQQAGLVVDRLHGKQQTVIKPLSRMLGSVPAFAGSAVMGNGRVALILDTGRLLRDAFGSGGAHS